MITTCEKCGGLKADPGEMYAGRGCSCAPEPPGTPPVALQRACSAAREITSDELLEINDLAMRVLKSRQNVGTPMKESARKVREITWRLATSQKPPNEKS
jgi:hypothetical protein